MTQQYKRSTNVEALEVDNEWMILHADQYTVTKLNEVGGLCWELLSEVQTLQSLAGELHSRYEISEEEAKGDVGTFLAELLTIGLVEYAG